MTDLDLLLFGCVVSFVAVAGAYVYLRERYDVHERQAEPADAPTARPAEAA